MDMMALHADDALLVLEKPAGLLSVPGRGADKQDCLASRAQRQWPDALVVHRLDMATSGLMLFARGAAMQSALNAAFARRAIHKRYVAIVHGLMTAQSGRIDAPLAADWPNRPRQQVDHERGKPSLSLWRVLQHDPELQRTRVELEPVTGRSHQLRVHLASIGHAIVGDDLYAGPQEASAPRLLLHASRLEFIHPGTGALVELESPPPF
jgi:tRNA pseudouridine32 synthase/23S rRNA pseudouridine746 synthase